MATISAEILAVKHQERNAAEMIAMQVTQDDCIDAAWIDVPRAQRNRSGRSTIDQDRALFRCQVEARVVAPAGAECVARADNGEPHVRPMHWSARRLGHASDAD